MVTMFYKIYGAYDFGNNVFHRMKESFNDSHIINLMDSEYVLIRVLNCDLTGTNMYSILIITANSKEHCEAVLEGQLTDGIFENCNYSKAVKFDLRTSNEAYNILNMIMKLDEKYLYFSDNNM